MAVNSFENCRHILKMLSPDENDFMFLRIVFHWIATNRQINRTPLLRNGYSHFLIFIDESTRKIEKMYVQYTY